MIEITVRICLDVPSRLHRLASGWVQSAFKHVQLRFHLTKAEAGLEVFISLGFKVFNKKCERELTHLTLFRFWLLLLFKIKLQPTEPVNNFDPAAACEHRHATRRNEPNSDQKLLVMQLALKMLTSSSVHIRLLLS